MERAQELGLLSFDDGQVVVGDPAFLDVGARLAALGVPIAEILDEYEHLQQVSDDLAVRFTNLFERNLWSPVADRGLPADELPTLADALAELGPMAEQIVVASMRRALVEQAQEFLATRAADLR